MNIMTSSHQRFIAVIIALLTAAATISAHAGQLVKNGETQTPICQHEGDPCGPPSLGMTCQRQGNGGALVCRASSK
jgi:hypothetical protein